MKYLPTSDDLSKNNILIPGKEIECLVGAAVQVGRTQEMGEESWDMMIENIAWNIRHWANKELQTECTQNKSSFYCTNCKSITPTVTGMSRPFCSKCNHEKDQPKYFEPVGY